MDGEDDDEEVGSVPVLLLVMGVMSWQVATLKTLPAIAVMVGMTDRLAQSVLGSVGKSKKGMICGDGVIPQDPRPSCWPCIAASKDVYSSCSVVDRLFWHQVEGEPAEGMFIAQLGCRGTVCEAYQITVAVFSCGLNTHIDKIRCDGIGDKMATWGLQMVVGLVATDRSTRGDGDFEKSFHEHIPFVEWVQRTKKMAYIQARHFTCGGSVVWALGSLGQHDKIWWFLRDSIRCKPWLTGTVARCGIEDRQRSTAALQARAAKMETRNQG